MTINIQNSMITKTIIYNTPECTVENKENPNNKNFHKLENLPTHHNGNVYRNK